SAVQQLQPRVVQGIPDQGKPQAVVPGRGLRRFQPSQLVERGQQPSQRNLREGNHEDRRSPQHSAQPSLHVLIWGSVSAGTGGGNAPFFLAYETWAPRVFTYAEYSDWLPVM